MKGSIRFTCRRKLRCLTKDSRLSWVENFPEYCREQRDVEAYVEQQVQKWKDSCWHCQALIRIGISVSEIEKTHQRRLP